MTQDEIIDMAHQASKLWMKEYPAPAECANPVPKRYLEIFAKLVAARAAVREREACAKLCEEAQTYSMPISCPDGISGCLVAHYIPARREKTGSEAAAAIRARGDNQ